MHTSQYKDEDGTVWYAHHNGDYSGNVKIEISDASPSEGLIEIPFGLMQELVGGWMQSKFIEKVEGLDGIEFLEMIGN